MLNKTFDKSHLPLETQEKQKSKGTWDSPCMSVCNYEGENLLCGTCGFLKAEKPQWVQGDETVKNQILDNICKRTAQK
jgi:predicted Fe-S protein YdhL (DUF1289 family)